jgi:hypothetical protein
LKIRWDVVNGKCIALIAPKNFAMSDAVAIMTGAMPPPSLEEWA